LRYWPGIQPNKKSSKNQKLHIKTPTQNICDVFVYITFLVLHDLEIRLFGKFHPDTLKAETSLRRNGRTDMARSTRQLTLIKNKYTFWSRKRLLHCKYLTEIIIPSAKV